MKTSYLALAGALLLALTAVGYSAVAAKSDQPQAQSCCDGSACCDGGACCR
jgi:hypothetical protein